MTEESNALLSRGVADHRAQRHAEALRAFEDAHGLTCAPRFLFLIGLERHLLGDDAGALRAFRDYLRVEASDIGRDRARLFVACLEERARSKSDADCLAENRRQIP